jgi:signal transduction histidine kinase
MTDSIQKTDKETLLLVDDTPDNIALLSSLLKGLYRTKVAMNGAKAIEVAATGEPPDLILLDIMMPDMDGYEVCKRLKENERLRDIPVIFLSSRQETMDKVTAFNAGAVDYVTKPFEFEEVRARVETHLKIRRLQIALEKQNQQLEANYEQLRALTEQKDEFLRIASHDLKNPLTGILCSASLVNDFVKPGTTMNDEMHQCLGRIIRQSRVMQKIIEDFLDFRALEDGQMRLVAIPMDLNETIGPVHERNEGYAREKSVNLVLELEETLPQIQADAARLSQVIENFISNSIKFSPRDTRTVVRTRSTTDSVIFEVEDSGPGLTDEDMGKLFVKYAQLSNKPTGGEKSSGLGLAICRKIIDLHGGKIGARNNPDLGATFWFELPRAS